MNESSGHVQKNVETKERGRETKGMRLSNNKLEEILFLFVLYTITHQPTIIKEDIIILLLL